MIDGPQVKNRRKLRILVAPLDWGLGHATRCIPVIYELLKHDVEVWLAGEKGQEILLKTEFPELPFLSLEGYRIRYGASRAGLLRAIFFQLPRIFKMIRRENKWLKEIVNTYQFDAVISDNRFGLSCSSIPSVFITHQLHIKTSLGKWMENLLQKLNYRYINQFTECWIPDDENELAGELSHPAKMPAIPAYYIGPLSRFRKTGISPVKKHLFIALSGPEPQRTLLENKIVNEISHYAGTATIVRGLPGIDSHIPSTNQIIFYNHLPAADMNTEMEKAEYVISRSGYSTIMDIVALNKKSILIPTPGQTEQEYLARSLSEKGIACYSDQQEFSLGKGLKKAAIFEYKPIFPRNAKGLSMFVESFLDRL
jgi:uncharacterized protein (TIGR00661 family)